MTETPTVVTYIGWFWRVGSVAGLVVALPTAYWGKDLIEAYGTPALLGLSPLALFLWTFLGSFWTLRSRGSCGLFSVGQMPFGCSSGIRR